MSSDGASFAVWQSNASFVNPFALLHSKNNSAGSPVKIRALPRIKPYDVVPGSRTAALYLACFTPVGFGWLGLAAAEVGQGGGMRYIHGAGERIQASLALR